MSAQRWIAFGAVLMALAVGLGAFGAHALRERLEPAQLEVWRTAVLYHGLHALGLIAFGLYVRRDRASPLVGWALLLGVLAFSGSLYALALGGPRWLGPVTPLGGTLFLFAWSLWAWCALRAGRSAT